MLYQDNEIDISDLKKADITVGDLKNIVTVLEAATSHLILPPEAMAALLALRKIIER